MAHRLSIQNTREWCAAETGALDSPEAASHSLLYRLASCRAAAPQPRLEILIISCYACARDSSVRIGRREPRLHFLNQDLSSPTSSTAPLFTCHGDMTHP